MGRHELESPYLEFVLELSILDHLHQGMVDLRIMLNQQIVQVIAWCVWMWKRVEFLHLRC